MYIYICIYIYICLYIHVCKKKYTYVYVQIYLYTQTDLVGGGGTGGGRRVADRARKGKQQWLCCSVLQCVAVRCIALHGYIYTYTYTYINVQINTCIYIYIYVYKDKSKQLSVVVSLKYHFYATPCPILQHASIQQTTTQCHTIHHTAQHCNACVSSDINTSFNNTLQHTAILCNTLQHTAIHCNTLQSRRIIRAKHAKPAYHQS